MEIRQATPADAPACVRILTTWIAETDWMPRLHGEAAMVAFWRARLGTSDGWAAKMDGTVCGFCLRDDGWVTALYLDPAVRRAGLGRRLLDRAKDGQRELRLRVFEANGPARAFYAAQGFGEVRRTADDNEEGLPDVELLWRR